MSTPSNSEVLTLRNDKKERIQRTRRINQKTALAFWSFVAPLILGLIVFFYIPIIWAVVLSFADARATITPTHFVGLQNYIEMLNDRTFTGTLGTFTVFAIFIVPTTFIFSLGLALLVNSVKFGQGFFRSVFFLPTACSYVLASVVWRASLFQGTFYGIANRILYLFHIDPIAWTSSPTPPWFWLVLVTVRLWLQVGVYMIIFIAGLQDIPRELYEAAYVDGARRGWQTFSAITFPLLRNASISVLLLNVIAAFQAFDEFFNILFGGNANLARTPLIYLYQVALNNQDYGLGSAGAIILTIIIVIFTLIQGKFLGFGTRD
ncbi:carbohydrate ABC transporter permease [Dictyobacter kobayashii]|uniref:carbohydrate ABC transporter permease n=1 Tax=Dictyobacter kobayashii TaxID=2014872 RepID=UPI00353173CA